MNEAALEACFRNLYAELNRSLEARAGGPFAAAVVRDGVLLGTGTNTVLRDLDVTRHAEMNALAAAGRKAGSVHLDGAVLLTTHLPCLMCYNAAKWARVREVYYLFDYRETEELFGFRGDLRLLRDLGLSPKALEADPAIRLSRFSTPLVDGLYRRELLELWRTSYRDLASYDV